MEKQRQDLLRAKEKYALKIRMIGDGPSTSMPDTLAACEKTSKSGVTSQKRGGQGGASVPSTLLTSLSMDYRGREASTGTYKAMVGGGVSSGKNQLDSQGLAPSPAVMTMAKKRRVVAQVKLPRWL